MLVVLGSGVFPRRGQIGVALAHITVALTSNVRDISVAIQDICLGNYRSDLAIRSARNLAVDTKLRVMCKRGAALVHISAVSIYQIILPVPPGQAA